MHETLLHVPEKFFLRGQQRHVDLRLVRRHRCNDRLLSGEGFKILETQAVLSGPEPLAVRVLIPNLPAMVHIGEGLQKRSQKPEVFRYLFPSAWFCEQAGTLSALRLGAARAET